eukprot:4133736-Pyramimonas_sp.AAC.1
MTTGARWRRDARVARGHDWVQAALLWGHSWLRHGCAEAAQLLVQASDIGRHPTVARSVRRWAWDDWRTWLRRGVVVGVCSPSLLHVIGEVAPASLRGGRELHVRGSGRQVRGRRGLHCRGRGRQGRGLALGLARARALALGGGPRLGFGWGGGRRLGLLPGAVGAGAAGGGRRSIAA